jgi:hypothetical protein
MFYCNECGKERKWPTDALLRSDGPCEICGKEADCNNVQSKYLPVPKSELKLKPSKVDFFSVTGIII